MSIKSQLQWSDILSRSGFIASKFSAIMNGLKYLGKKDKSEVLSIGTYLEQNALLHSNRKALLYEDLQVTHHELNEWINRYANYLISQGIRKGDCVAIFLENRPEILVCAGALAKIGAIASLINTSQRQTVLIHSFQLCQPQAYIIGEELFSAFSDVVSSLSLIKNRCYFLQDREEVPVPEGWIDFAEATKLASSTNPPTTKQVRLEDPCFYVYTSGTTGLPKASIMTHFRWVKASAAFGMLGLNMQPNDVIYVSLPFYHNNALTIAWSSAASGGSAIAMRRKFSASRFWEDTRKFNATAFCYIGELCRYLINQPSRPDDSHNPVYKIVGNGLRPDIWYEFKRRFGIREVYEFYSASEANVGFVNLFNFDCTVGFCPAPYELVQYKIETDELIKDSQGFLVKVPKGGVGLLIAEVSEKYAFDGYTDKAASEKKLLRNVFRHGDLWYNSGDLLKDLGFRHAQFVDRLGDTFRWKGENVSTTEVEEAANHFEMVKESTVYGVSVPGCDGKAGMISIVGNGDITGFHFKKFYQMLAEELPNYAIPLFLRYQSELEATGTFKHKKMELRNAGFDPNQITDPVYILLPKAEEYVPLTQAIFQQIQTKTHKL